ncbi:outer membrane protein assembly factor BamB family protein [Mycolicibacterium sp. XJ870]
MARVGREEIAENVRCALRPVSAVLAGAAVVLLALAVALGLWSRLGASRSLGEDSWYLSNVHRWGNGLPNGIAISVCGVAIVLFAAMAHSRWRGRNDDAYLPGGSAACAAVMVLLFFAYCTPGIPEFYRLAMVGSPVTTAVPTAVAAWGLSIAGTVATLLAASAFPRLGRSSTRLVAVGAAIGVVVAAVVTVVAVRAGDDSRYVDATTADAMDVPAAPASLGQRAFTVTVPDAFTEDPPRPQALVAAGGPGFVVYHDHRVTAYGNDGNERWHYTRTGPGDVSVNGMRVFDNGSTVVVFVRDALVGLDATTGEQLWTSTDSRMIYAISQEPGYNLVSPFVVYRGEDAWTRYDTRTGSPMWTVRPPDVPCEFPARAADTPSWLVSVSRCPAGDGVDIRVLALDPATGETRWDSKVLSGQADMIAVANPANAAGVFVQFGGAGSPRGMSYVNVADKTVTPLPERGSGEPSVGPADDFVFSGWEDGRQVVLFGPDGTQRCTAASPFRGAETQIVGQGNGLAYVSFGDDFVIADRAGALRTFDSTTCAQTASAPAEAVAGFVPVPEAVLALRHDGRNLLIDGYTAG